MDFDYEINELVKIREVKKLDIKEGYGIILDFEENGYWNKIKTYKVLSSNKIIRITSLTIEKIKNVQYW